ncbi:Eukaryotic initiation factor 4E family protein [Theileria parva strain Muguga]|uniref:Eukaryotic initiation factor 4E family protein n=1 Tax=Theileria parva strain Muguga TaxID=333668 RepID=UPI001C619B93|nr:Eukaryotic initiation factor 4E family protein [Theileria parva strain Muguga]EAN33019.2 Eukaryotic initiation factor 4E family protein [Theileria parva strain Muguga]
MAESASVAVNGTKKCPSLTFNKNTEDHAKLSELFESTTINLDTPLSLKNKWVIWEQIVKMPEHSQNDYKEHTKPLVSFDSVQAFWNLWFNIPQPSELATNKRLARECSDGSEHFVDAIMGWSTTYVGGSIEQGRRSFRLPFQANRCTTAHSGRVLE